MAFPTQWMDELLSRSDITEVVSSYVSLKPKGRKLWGLCPFHGEKTASFSVTPERQMYYCFGCHEGGSAIHFIMQIEKLSYGEAVRFLAERAHMALPENGISDEEFLRNKAYKERIKNINRLAARFFCERFLSEEGEGARAYAAARGITKEMVLRFGIGYAPDAWENLKKHLMAEGFSEKEMIAAGVLIHNPDKNSTYDVYRNRLMFPIQSITGEVIGFGGRVVDDGKPKYINTGDTPIYNKRNNLYGLNLIKQEKNADIIIVEGYMDVVGLYKAGIHNAVASLGTSLTVEQARLLKRFTSQIIIAYDGDFAGQKGMIRGLEILQEQGLDVHIIIFPENLDPDEYVQKYGKDAFNKLKTEALTVSAFKLERMADGYSFDKEDDREKYALEACKYIKTLQPVQRERYIRIVAEKTGYPENILKKQAGGSQVSIAEWQPEIQLSAAVQQRQPADAEEKAMLLAAWTDKKALRYLVQQNAEELFTEETYKKLFLALKKGNVSPAAYLSEQSEEDAGKLTALISEEGAIVDAVKTAVDCVKRLRGEALEKQLADMKQRYASGVGDDALLKEIMSLSLKIKNLNKE